MIGTDMGRGVELGECAGWGGEKAMKGWMGVGIVQKGIGAMGGSGSLGSVQTREERTVERSVGFQLRRGAREWIARRVGLHERRW